MKADIPPERSVIPSTTEGETLDELKENIKDAVKCHFDEKDRPHIARLHMVKDEVMAL